MDQKNSNHWRQMFGDRQRPQPSDLGGAQMRRSAAFGYDDGYDPARDVDAAHQHGSLSPEEITDEAAMALALDAPEYRPWILQRGRTRPVMMLHLRRFDTRSQLWQGWQMSYPHLVAVEYTGDTMLSLDFGTRQFMIEGTGLDELARNLQSGTVLIVQQYTENIWHSVSGSASVRNITKIASS